jgi:hypothetical protein
MRPPEKSTPLNSLFIQIFFLLMIMIFSTNHYFVKKLWCRFTLGKKEAWFALFFNCSSESIKGESGVNPVNSSML